jgi:4-carboxymuconolactone decarboxylase
MSNHVLPADVYAESGYRLPLPRREHLDEEGKAAFDQFLVDTVSAQRGPAGPGVGLRGPGGIQLYSPGYAKRIQEIFRYLRFECGMSGRTRELAILVAAREADQQFEWTFHEPMAVREGLEPEVIDIVRKRGDAASLAEEDALIVLIGREAIGARRKPSSETFSRALAAFGAQRLVEIVALMGEYVACGVLLNVFGMELPAERPPTLTDC